MIERKEPQKLSSDAPPRNLKKFVAPLPPWQFSYGAEPLLSNAVAAEKAGQLPDAERMLNDFIKFSSSPVQSQQLDSAYLELLSVLLKQGKSRDVLRLVQDNLKRKGILEKELSSVESLSVGFAYFYEGDSDQAIAWLLQAGRRDRGNDEITHVVGLHLREIVREIPENSFDKSADRWSKDSYVSDLFFEERTKRSNGGGPLKSKARIWFEPQTYQQPGSAVDLLKPAPTNVSSNDLPSADTLNPDIAKGGNSIGQAPGSGALVIGILLPLSGEYAYHAQRVKEGVELAMEKLVQQGSVRLVTADTLGDPQQARSQYRQLVINEKATVVIGPMLARSSEAVAQESLELGVPVLTFSKRDGIASSKAHVFRLGITAEDQVRALLASLSSKTGAKRIALLIPNSGVGREFSSAFKDLADKSGFTVVSEQGMPTSDSIGFTSVISELESSRPDAVFVGESLGKAWGFFEALQGSNLREVTLLGPAQWSEDSLLTGLTGMIDGAFVVSPFYAASTRPQLQQFVSDYNRVYAKQPTLLSAQGYDAATVVQEVSCQDQQSCAFSLDKLESLKKMPSVTGVLSVDAKGEFHRDMNILKLEQGAFAEVAPQE